MSFEEPTRRLSVPPSDAAQTTAALPRPLQPAGEESSPEPPARTDELSIAEIFETPPQPAPVEQPRADEAPTWTAMPVIPVRSEPVRSEPVPDAPATGRHAQTPPDKAEPATTEPDKTTQTDTKRTGPSTAERLFTDASAAWDGALRRTRGWLIQGDNGLMLMTAVVAVILILVVAAVGS